MMMWSLRNFIFFYKKPAIFFRDLSEKNNTANFFKKYHHQNDGYNFVKIENIDDEFEEQFNGAIRKIDFKPPFDLDDARNRLKRGYMFFVIFFENEIVGWRWYAFKKVFCEDFRCNLKIRDDQAYGYNLFVNKDHRGKHLAARLIISGEPYLREIGVKSIWIINYDWNIPAQATVRKAGYRKIGYYRLVNILGLKLHSFPKIIKK